MPTKPQPIPERFWAKVEKSDGCWRWTGTINEAGYGVFFLRSYKSPERAHRLSYMFATGALPAPGIDLHHVCHNPWCVNPAHLEPLDRKTHTAAHPEKGVLNHNARKQVCKHGHPLTEGTFYQQGTRRRCKRCHNARVARSYAKRAAAKG